MSSLKRTDVFGDLASSSRPSDGERVLWIHGYTMDSRIWDELWSYLPNWHHVAIDLPGHGRSPPLAAGTDLSDLGRLVGRFAVEQDIQHVVGLSFGGMIALQVTIEYPDAFASLVLGAPALGGGPQDRHAQARNLELMRMYSTRSVGPWLRDLWMTSPPNIFAGASKHPELWHRLRDIVGEHRWSELADSRMRALTSYCQSLNDLRRVTAAALILIGDEDAEAFKRSAELIRRHIPTCRRVYLEQTGHLTLLERAATIHPLIDDHFRAASRRRSTFHSAA
jgi:pimeloyl-ACP methyl ester carboxylesterase